MKPKKKISDFSQKIITFIGYWWLTLTVMINIWQLVDFLFTISINFPINIVILIGVILISLIIALVLLKSFPYVLDKIFDKQALEEKYYYISEEERTNFLKSIIFSNLPYIKNEEYLLKSLRDACSNNDYELAIKIGLNNSPMFYHLKNNYVRVLNGIVTLYALEKAKDFHIVKEHSKKYYYVLCSVLINDLGWSLCKLSNTELIKINNYLELNPDIKEEIKSICSFNNSGAEDLGLANIKYARKLLENKNIHPKLVAQSIRHLLNFTSCIKSEPKLFYSFEKIIKKINNEADRTEMQGNLYFYLAVQKLLEQNNHLVDKDIVLQAIKEIDLAKENYLKIQDYSRLSKCYNIKGKLFQLLSNFSEAKREFENGLREAYNVIRYDEVLENLYCLALLCRNSDKSTSYARDGLDIAQSLENKEFIAKFNLLYKPKQIILIRHGEATKNTELKINGEGKLTEFGKEHITTIAKNIADYLKCYNYHTVKIFGDNKTQVNNTISILLSEITNAESKNSDNFKPTYMGKLYNVNENDNDLNVIEYINNLKLWRVGVIDYSMLDIPEIEPPIDNDNTGFWHRAKLMYDEISKEECSIVVCTTSIAILLTQFILNNEFNSNTYKHIDVPLGGIIHFVEDVSSKGNPTYKLVNKEEFTNINFRSL